MREIPAAEAAERMEELCERAANGEAFVIVNETGSQAALTAYPDGYVPSTSDVQQPPRWQLNR